jgi:phosphoribosylformylglycinamidine cyclo-ligase
VKATYESSGVSIRTADKFVNEIKSLVKTTFTKGVIGGIGNFGGFFQPQLKKFSNPILVSSVDGVGTKLKLAQIADKYDTIGEDLVNHCVNDIAVCGAVPLFFLDYYATGKLNEKNAVEIIKGFVRGCRNNICSLIGGETAEMPGIYSNEDFDLAGTVVGIVDRKKVVNYKKVSKGDVLIGLKSNGFHTNGYSLIRKIFNSRKKLFTYYSEFENELIFELLKVHKSYLNIIQSSLQNFKIKSISHITGGGIEGNTRRVIPEGCKLSMDWNSWERPFVFDLVQKKGNVPENDMRKTFNLGIGLIFIVSKNDADKFKDFLKKKREISYIIGEIN